MNVKQVPQQADTIYEGEKKLIYATDDMGKINAVQTSGWQVEIDSLKDAVQEMNSKTLDALARARSGRASTLEYYMYRQRMDEAMLAKAMGKFKWQIKRHFNVKKFERLSNDVLSKYAGVLGIETGVLKSLPK